MRLVNPNLEKMIFGMNIAVFVKTQQRLLEKLGSLNLRIVAIHRSNCNHMPEFQTCMDESSTRKDLD